MKNVPTNLRNLENKVDKLDVDKLAELDSDKLKPVSVDLRKLTYVLKLMLLKKMCITLRSRIFKIKCLILLTYLLILLLMLK